MVAVFSAGIPFVASNVTLSHARLDVHAKRGSVKTLWFMWWGACNIPPGAARESRREECSEQRRGGGFSGFCFGGVRGLLVP